MKSSSHQDLIRNGCRQPQRDWVASPSDAVATDSTIAIAARGIEMIFETRAERFYVLKGVDLTVLCQHIHLVMGPAGAGKTTLLLVLAGLLTPTSGSVCLLGEDMLRLSRSQREHFRLHHVGFVDQEFNLFSALTALENVSITLTLKGWSEYHARQEAQHLLEQVGLSDKLHNLPCELSGGQQQRVAIARAVAGYPALILADEPTASLDSHTGKMVMQLFHHLSREQGCTIVMATHDARVTDVADQITLMEDGMILSKLS
jgi:putative ABC transport system ATP-binding protein